MVSPKMMTKVTGDSILLGLYLGKSWSDCFVSYWVSLIKTVILKWFHSP